MRIIILIVFFLLSFPARAEVIDLTAHTGLKGAYLVQQNEAEFVNVQLLLDVGEADYDGPEGLAHYLEHLVWYSADKAHGNLAKNRISNAWTNIQFTNYWNSGEPAKLGDMLATSAQVFEAVDLARDFAMTERDVVEREFDYRKLDNPGWQLYNQMNKALLPNHAMSRSVIGSLESIRKITPEMAIAFKDKWYFGNNATLLITGPVSAADVVPLLKKHLRDVPQGTVPAHPWKKTTKWDGRNVRTVLRHSKIAQPFFEIYIRAPRPTGMSVAEAARSIDVLSSLMNSSTPGSPSKVLYYEDFILSAVSGFAWQDRTGSIVLAVNGRLEEGVSMEEALNATWDYLDGLTTFPGKSFALVHQDLVQTFDREKYYPKTQQNVAFRGLLERGSPYSSKEYLADIAAVTPAQVDALLKAFKNNGISVTGIALPEEDN